MEGETMKCKNCKCEDCKPLSVKDKLLKDIQSILNSGGAFEHIETSDDLIYELDTKTLRALKEGLRKQASKHYGKGNW